ncbi:MAG: sigma-70 family RNA polymerase sigma factor [bacterium]
MANNDASRERSDREDRDLVRRSLEGNEGAFEELVRRFQAPVLNLAYRVVRDWDESQDVAQEAFVKAYGALNRYDATYPFKVWLFRITTNVAIDHLRRRRGGTVSLDAPRYPGSDDDSGWDIADDASPGPGDGIESAQRREILDIALAKLAPPLRAAIVLRHVEDLSYEEIAATLGIPLGTVKIRIHRGREALARILKRQMKGDDAL